MSKVTAKYQITIPPEIRKGLRIKPGMEVDIAQKGEKFELIVNPVEELKKDGVENIKAGKRQTNIWRKFEVRFNEALCGYDYFP